MHRVRSATMMLLIAGPVYAQGQHCTKPVDQGIAFLSSSVYTTTDGFGARGQSVSYGERARFTRAQLGSYTEYGYSDRLTLVTNVNAVRLTSTSAGTTRTSVGLGNPEAGVQIAVDDVTGVGRFFCAANLTVKLPLRSGGDPVIGFQQTDVELGLRSLGNFALAGKSGYWVTDVAYRTRFGAPADELRINATAAYHFSPYWYYTVQALTTTGMHNGQPIDVGSNFVLDPNYSSYSAQSSVMFRSSRTRWIQVGGSREVAGRNSGHGTTASVVLWQYF